MANKITMTCDRCGGQCEIMDGGDVWICPYCGTKSVIKQDIIINNAAPKVDTGVLALLFKKGNDNVTIESAKGILAIEPTNKEALETILVCYMSKAMVQCDKFLFSNYAETRKNAFALMFLTSYRKIGIRMCSEIDYNSSARSILGVFHQQSYQQNVGCSDDEFMRLMTSFQYATGMNEPESYAYINSVSFKRTHTQVSRYIEDFVTRAMKCCDLVTSSVCVERLFRIIEDSKIIESGELDSLKSKHLVGLMDEARSSRENGKAEIVIRNKTGLIWGFPAVVTVKDLIDNTCLTEKALIKKGGSLTVTGRPGPVFMRFSKTDGSCLKEFSEALFDNGRYTWDIESNDDFMYVKKQN